MITAILSRVQHHINLLTPHCVRRCCRVSSCPQVLQRFVSARRITASLFCRDEVVDDREPYRFLFIRDASCVEVGPQALPVGLWILANNSHFIAPSLIGVHRSDCLVYPASKLVPVFKGIRGRYIGNV